LAPRNQGRIAAGSLRGGGWACKSKKCWSGSEEKGQSGQSWPVRSCRMTVWHLPHLRPRHLIPMNTAVIRVVIDAQATFAIRKLAFPALGRSPRFACHHHSCNTDFSTSFLYLLYHITRLFCRGKRFLSEKVQHIPLANVLFIRQSESVGRRPAVHSLLEPLFFIFTYKLHRAGALSPASIRSHHNGSVRISEKKLRKSQIRSLYLGSANRLYYRETMFLRRKWNLGETVKGERNE
jgi:hypothetical protein